jgi:tetraacyldisaccharide 4'-kinase
MKTPSWWNERNITSVLLLPISVLYESISVLRRSFIAPIILPVPVICIGGLTAGGAGKTPVALHIGKLAKERGIETFFLSRGYGGTLEGPVLVDLAKHNAQQVGDEPLLLAKVLPTVVAKDRLSGARFAITQGAKAIIMDDGLQNPAIVKTLSLVVIDGTNAFGNRWLMPSGPLREIPNIGLGRAHAAIIVDRTIHSPNLPPGLPVLAAKTIASTENALRGKKVIAFCGIASPKKFFTTLTNLGVSPVETIAFPDHYLYSADDWKKLVKKANSIKAGLVTTAKDAVRLPPSVQKQLSVVDITLSFDNPVLLDAVLDFALGPRPEQPSEETAGEAPNENPGDQPAEAQEAAAGEAPVNAPSEEAQGEAATDVAGEPPAETPSDTPDENG